MEGEWISAARAHQMVSSALSGGGHLAICSRAFDGLIKARAKRLVAGTRVFDGCTIPETFWWARGHAALTQNWATGDFETWIEQKQWRVYGVEFALEDIETMLPSTKRNIEFDRLTPGNYAPASRCLEELESALQCAPQEAEHLILRAAQAGLVSGRCAQIEWRVTDRYGTQEEEEELSVGIPDWFWEHCTSNPSAILNWRVNRFAGRGIIDGAEYRVKISGVELLVSDIVEVELANNRHSKPEQTSRTQNAPKSASATIGRRQSDRWRPWIAELVTHIHENGYPQGQGSQGQEEVINAVADALAQRGIETLGRSTVQPVVQAVLDRLRSPAEN